MIDLLVCYDVNTLTPEGRKRLRRIARICTNFGQRVQESVFEVSVNPVDRERFLEKLRAVVAEKEDSLRIYTLRGGRDGIVVCYGLDRYTDFTAPLVT